MKDGKKTGVFESLDGKEYTITGFTKMMAVRVDEAVKANWELEEKRPLPKRPTYKVEGDDAFGGEEIVFYHTEETLFQPLTDEEIIEGKKPKYLPEVTKEEKRAWENYQRTQSELDTRIWKQMMYEAMNCVEVSLDDLKEYIEKKSRDTGMAYPNPEKYEVRAKRLFVEEVVLCDDTDEMMRLLAETMRVAGVISDKEVSKALESFRNQEVEQGSEPAERQDSVEQAGNS